MDKTPAVSNRLLFPLYEFIERDAERARLLRVFISPHAIVPDATAADIVALHEH